MNNLTLENVRKRLMRGFEGILLRDTLDIFDLIKSTLSDRKKTTALQQTDKIKTINI